MKKTAAFVLVAVTLFSWQTLSSSSSATGSLESTEDRTSVILSVAELKDLSAIAKTMGLTLDQAITRYSWNQSFAELTIRVRGEEPKSFSGAEIISATHAQLSFVEAPSSSTRELIRIFSKNHPNVTVEVKVDALLSEKDLERMIEAAHYAAFNHEATSDSSTTFDPATSHLNISVSLKDHTKTGVEFELRQVVSSAITERGLEHILDAIQIKIHVSHFGPLGGLDANNVHIGGELLNGIGCTSGFVVVKEDTGPVGISTASHCEDQPATDDGIALTFQSQHFGVHGDAQWRTGTQPLPPDFYAGSPTVTETDRRTVTDLGSPVVGQALCKNGRTNHQQCQEVRRLHVCRSSACNMVQMGARLAASGDSGGPVYWNTTAYGLHSGWQYDPAWPNDRDYFSRADRLPQALGVHVVK